MGQDFWWSTTPLFKPPPHPLLSHDIHAEHAMTYEESQVPARISYKVVVVIDEILKEKDLSVEVWVCKPYMYILEAILLYLPLTLVFAMRIEKRKFQGPALICWITLRYFRLMNEFVVPPSATELTSCQCLELLGRSIRIYSEFCKICPRERELLDNQIFKVPTSSDSPELFAIPVTQWSRIVV